MESYYEQPFEYLKRKATGEKFEKEVYDNWYIARAFVLDKLKDVAFEVDSGEHLRVVVQGDSPLMLSIVRQVALSAHYVNYDEENPVEARRKRTIITIVSQNPKIMEELQKEEYLCNLPKYCKWSQNGIVHNADSYIDIEIEIVRDCFEEEQGSVKVVREEELKTFCCLKPEHEIFWIDTRKAQYAGRMYDLGGLIDNLPAENIHDAHRYAMALDVYQFRRLMEPLKELVNDEKWSKNQVKVKGGLSNVFCADRFETIEKEVAKSKEKEIENCREEAVKDGMRKADFWEKYNEALSKSEHSRWVAEKLIMGFSPLNNEERLLDESLAPYKNRRKEFRDSLKNDENRLAHIDLCSNADLRRVNPEDMKYDSFLMLAIPKILEKIG